MDRVNAVIRHPMYQEYYRRLEMLEKDRVFCTHQMDHLLAVARIAWIRNLEEGLGLQKDIIYTAAVLHDIGKSLQYEKKIPHETAGEEIAGQILDDLGREDNGTGKVFTQEEKADILRAVRGHRRLHEGMEPLERLLCESDKKSRLCFACQAEALCDWSDEKKNMEIEI